MMPEVGPLSTRLGSMPPLFFLSLFYVVSIMM